MGLATHIRVSVLMQRCQSIGEAVYIVARGDAEAGAVIVKHAHLDGTATVLARRYGMDGAALWEPVTGSEPLPEAEADAYLARRRDTDPDLWIVEIESHRDSLPLTDV